MPTPTRILCAGLAPVLLAACTTVDRAASDTVGQAQLNFADGRPAGKATLVRDGAALRVQVSVAGLAPGPHGFHLHTTGRCAAPDFASAGGHLNPDARKHGSLAQGGAHLGDLPNLIVGANGTGTADAEVAGGAAAIAAIFDTDGTAVIVHADADDYRTDPTGNAGGRVACGIVTKT